MIKKKETRLFVKPAKGLEVLKNIRDLGRKELINVEGEYVENSLFYRRLIKRGELVKCSPKTTNKKN